MIDFYLHLNGLINNANDEGNFNFQPYLPCEIKRIDENMFLTTYSVMRYICSRIQHHNQICTELLDAKILQRYGHTAKVTFTCKDMQSPGHCRFLQHFPGRFFFQIHSVYATGMHYIQYKRDSANIIIVPESAFVSHHNLYYWLTNQ